MSRCSKLANIRHKEEKNGAAKDKIFTVIGREIAVAVKEGGPGPANNSKFRDIIAKTKANNVPDDAVDNGIKKAAGGLGSVNYEQNVYEGYGPSGVAVIVEALTDNKDRTAANVHAAFLKGGGNVGTPSCVSFTFDRRGQTIIDREECGMDPGKLVMLALGTGAEDFADNENSYEVLTDPEQFSVAREALEQKGIPVLETDVKMIPWNWVSLKNEEDQKKMQHILDLLDEDDDVQTVFHNQDEK